MLSSVTSQGFHVALRRLVWGPEGADNAPTFYRINTVKAIKAAAERNGFVCEYLDSYSSAYAYFRMSRATFFIACVANKIMSLWSFRAMRLTLLCVLRKPASE